MLFKLSLSNIRKSIRDYAIYFFTLIIGVAVFYVFNAIGGQGAMLAVQESRYEIIQTVDKVLSGVSVYVAFVLGLLIVYASRFLMKRRSKEFALYMTLGMSKWKISAILLLETVFIGIGSLFVGLVIGIGLSQVMSALVANLFEIDMSAYRFTISGNAIVKTILYFVVMYLVVMFFNGVIVTKMKLITLLQAGKRSEQVKLKNPVLCVIIFLIAAAMLGYAYYNVGWSRNDMSQSTLMIYIIMGIVGTVLVFWSVSGMMLRIAMSSKNLYFKGLNCFTFRQISSKINTMVVSMSLICLMQFITICSLSGAFCVRNSMNKNFRTLCPADNCQIVYNNKSELPDIVELYSENNFDLLSKFSNYLQFRTFEDNDLTMGASLGKNFEKFREKYSFLNYDSKEEIVKLSDYNKLTKLYGQKELTLNDGEYAVVCNFKSMTELRDESLGIGTELNIFGNILKPALNKCIDGFITIGISKSNVGFFVVPDNVVDGRKAVCEYFIGNYSSKDKEATDKAISDVFYDFSKGYNDYNGDRAIIYYSKCEMASDSIGIGALVTLLGLYIGLVFLIACGAILALKELSESVDSIGRYEMLRKLGVDEKEISSSLFRQTGIFFLIPIILACIHSAVGMKYASYILEAVGTENINESILGASCFILLIYGGYFLVTYFCGKNIIKEKK